jgi:hypothetical protein
VTTFYQREEFPQISQISADQKISAKISVISGKIAAIAL